MGADGLLLNLFAALTLSDANDRYPLSREGFAATWMAIARLGDDFFAYPPLCPHQEEVLAVSGVCDGSTLTCTKHLWQWDMRSGSEIGLAEKPLLMYQVRRDGDEVSILLEQELKYDYED